MTEDFCYLRWCNPQVVEWSPEAWNLGHVIFTRDTPCGSIALTVVV